MAAQLINNFVNEIASGLDAQSGRQPSRARAAEQTSPAAALQRRHPVDRFLKTR
jgi:hypothetical protein